MKRYSWEPPGPNSFGVRVCRPRGGSLTSQIFSIKFSHPCTAICPHLLYILYFKRALDYRGELVGLLLLLLQHSLDNLLLLNQERSDNSLLDTVGASRATVSSLDGLAGLGDVGVLSWSQRGNTGQGNATVATLDLGRLLLDVLGDQLSTWGLDDLDLVGSGVVWTLVTEFYVKGIWGCADGIRGKMYLDCCFRWKSI